MKSFAASILTLVLLLSACNGSDQLAGQAAPEEPNVTNPSQLPAATQPADVSHRQPSPATPPPPPAEEPTEPPADPNQQVVRAANQFGWALYQRVAGGQDNLFYSSASIHTALSMTLAGAAGDTADQMQTALAFPAGLDSADLHSAYGRLIERLNSPRMGPENQPVYQLSVANALWGQQGFDFRRPFLSLVEDSYAAGLRRVDFAQAEQARETINTWVSEQTNEKIPDLIPEGAIDARMRLVLTNAVYFKSSWMFPFTESATADETFYAPAGEVETPLMHLTEHVRHADVEGAAVVELPYQGNELSMIVMLPDERDGLAAMERQLTAERVQQWIDALGPARVAVTLPKFEFTRRLDLARILAAMGMVDAFDPSAADFSPMTGGRDLFISDVLHKAFVAVDEEGTEAAAATAVMMRMTAMPVEEEPIEFRADHPFAFVIRHNRSGLILFTGRVANPTE